MPTKSNARQKKRGFSTLNIRTSDSFEVIAEVKTCALFLGVRWQILCVTRRCGAILFMYRRIWKLAKTTQKI